jgi:CO/xanthine dehydrogenase FAD-binding subunit
MITEYHRPSNLQEALNLLSRKGPVTIPLGGGTSLSRFSKDPVEVVDLQLLNLNKIWKKCEFLSIGATTTLQSLMDYSDTPISIKDSLLFEGTHNLRQVATVGGTLVSSKGDSLFSAMILACNAEMQWEPGALEFLFEKWLSEPKFQNQAKLLVEIHFLFESKVKFEKVSITPRSKPDLFVVKAIQGKQMRYVLGGKCNSLHLFTGDLIEKPQKLAEFLKNAYSDFIQSKLTLPYFESTVTTLLKRLDVQ